MQLRSGFQQQRGFTFIGVSLGILLLANPVAQAASLGCLLVDIQNDLKSYSFSRSVLNLDSGALSEPLEGITAVPLSQDFQRVDFADPAPDGKHDEYIAPDKEAADSSVEALYIRQDAPLGAGTKVRDFAVADVSDVSTLWSSDSQWLVYLWTDLERKLHLGLADVNGKELQEIDLESQPGDQLVLETDSVYPRSPTDSSFIQILKQSPNRPITVTIYSLPSLKLQTSIVPPTCLEALEKSTQACSSWSPQDHYIAYIGWTNPAGMMSQVPQLLLYAPGTDAQVIFPLDRDAVQPGFANTLWSPNGQYIAVEDYPASTFSVFGVDGSVRRNIATHYRTYFCGDCYVPGAVEWSRDSQSVYFVEQHAGTNDQSMAFNVQSRHIQTVIPDLQDPNPPLYTANGRYVLTEWGKNTAVGHTSILDTVTGQSLALAPDGELVQFGWLRNETLAWALSPDLVGEHLAWTTVPQFSRRDVLIKDFLVDNCCQFSQDGHWLLLTGVTNQNLSQAWLINLNTGNYRKVAESKGQLYGLFSGDSKIITIYTKLGSDKQFLSLVPVDGRSPVSINTQPDALTFSPDSSMLAYFTTGEGTIDRQPQLRIISLDGKRIKVFDPFEDPELTTQGNFISALKWTACIH